MLRPSIIVFILVLMSGCEAPVSPPPADWTAVDDAVIDAASQFSDGLTVEVILPTGVVHSASAGGFSSTDAVPVASASKWVSATVILQLVDQGVFGQGQDQGLDTPTSALLTDQNGQSWSGHLGSARLRHLLSFTTGINGDTDGVEACATLDESVKLIYSDQAAGASSPGGYYYYGGPRRGVRHPSRAHTLRARESKTTRPMGRVTYSPGGLTLPPVLYRIDTVVKLMIDIAVKRALD